jgi:ApaG protein
MTYPFVSTNNDFRIEVKTNFEFDQSNPLQFHYLFSYTILITNLGPVPAQLLSRKWFIKDAKGEVRVVEGPGVIGQTPNFEPDHSFEYSSFCPLPTLTGEMWGHFNMIDKEGRKFQIETPHFKFAVPKEYIDDY